MVAVFAGLVTFVSRRRSTQQNALVTIIAVAAGARDMPLAPALDAVSDQFTGVSTCKVRTLAHYLKNGVAFPEALDRAPGAAGRGRTPGPCRKRRGQPVGARRVGGSDSFWDQAGLRMRLHVELVISVCALRDSNHQRIPVLLHRSCKSEAILRDFNLEPPAPTQFIMWLGMSLGSMVCCTPSFCWWKRS